MLIPHTFSILSGCLGIQQFSKEPDYTEVNPGANAKLECQVQNIGGECRWQKDGKVIIILLSLESSVFQF